MIERFYGSSWMDASPLGMNGFVHGRKLGALHICHMRNNEAQSYLDSDKITQPVFAGIDQHTQLKCNSRWIISKIFRALLASIILIMESG